MKGQINLEQWKKALSANLPGEQAQLGMAPQFNGRYDHDTDPVPAAVLILIYPHMGKRWLVLMKRNTYDGHHSAQVSFPGGAWEPGDESLQFTALRETREELGITEEIQILGSLTELHIPVSNFLVTPFAGWTGSRPLFQPDPSEVQYIIETPIGDLLDPQNRLSETMHRHEQSIVAPYYRIGKEKIWGATAMMLCEFLQLAARMQ